MQFSPSEVFCADTGIYTGAVLADDTGAVRVIQVGLPLSPVAVAAVCLQDIALHDPSHLWDKVIDTGLTVTARTYKHRKQCLLPREGGEHSTKLWVGVCHWETETLTLY